MDRIRVQRGRELKGTRLTVFTGVFVCFGIIIPYITAHAYGLKGTVFLPMHIPVIMCGFFCGARRGFLCGIITPITSSLLTGMPPAYPMLPIMLVELSMYGFVSGYLIERGFSAITSQLTAMAVGRICYAIVFYILLLNNPSLKLVPNPVLASMPILSMFILGIPGTIIQLILIPILSKQLSIYMRKL